MFSRFEHEQRVAKSRKCSRTPADARIDRLSAVKPLLYPPIDTGTSGDSRTQSLVVMPTTQSLDPTSTNPKPIMPLWKAWWLAARPKTLPAAIAPVIAGSAVAIHEHGFFLPAAVAALITALAAANRGQLRQ